jgi:hypothetical protein
MEEDSSPAAARPRKPRAKTGTRVSGGKGAAPRAKRAPAPKDAAPIAPAAPNRGPEAPPQFDHLVADDGFVRDFDRLASSNPKSAVVTALAVGIAVGFLAALILSRD